MGRSPSCDKNGLKKGPWTPEEDNKLVQYIQRHGHGSWRTLPKLAGLNRCGKSCRLRWTNYLRPDIKRGKFSPEEEQTILNLHSILGNKWSAIATHLPGRTDNEIKNFYNTHLKKKLIQMGLDPMTHRPRDDLLAALPHLVALAGLQSLSDGDQIVKMQAEAAKLNYLQCLLHSSAPTTSVSNNNSLSLPSQPMISNTLAYSTTTAITAPLSIENPCSFDQALSNGTGIAFSQGEGNGLSTALVSPLPLPPLTGASAANSGDGCSKTRYGGSDTSFLCPELFVDEPFMIELA